MKKDRMKKAIATVGIAAQCGLIATLLFAPSAHSVLGGLAILALMCLVGLLCLRQTQKKETERKDVVPEVPPVAPPRKPTETKLPPTEEPPAEELPSSYFERYLGIIAEKHGEAAADRVRGDVTAILGKDSNGRIDEILSRPESNGRAKGLVVGRVQSGKTQNYTGLITRAIDEGWRIIVVLTSNNTALESQTIARLRTDLSDSGMTNDKYRMVDNFLSDDLPTIERGKIYVGVALKQPDHLRGRAGNGKGVLNWLKGGNNLEDARILIIDDEADNATQNTVAGQDDWSDDAVQEYVRRIVDEAKSVDKVNAGCVAAWIMSLDESKIDLDKAEVIDLRNLLEKPFFSDSVIGGAGKESKVKVSDVIGNPGYQKILGLGDNVAAEKVKEALQDVTVEQKKQIKNFSIGQYSNVIKNFFIPPEGQAKRAKEFRQILRWFLNVRRERSEINKAICELVSPQTLGCEKLAYVGYTATPYADFLNEVKGADNPLEIDFIQSMSLSPEYFGLSKIFGKDETENEPRMPIVKIIPTKECGVDLSSSLQNAIKWAMVAASVRRARRIEKGISENDDKSRPERWSTMLVNLSRKIEDHCDFQGRITTYIEESLEDKSGFRKECLDLFDEFVHDVDAEGFKKLFPDYTQDVRDVRREDVVNNLDYVFGHFKVVALNSNGDNKDVYCEYVQDVRKGEKLFGDYLWIIVGGNRISRGLTFDGLVSSYFDRDKVTVNVDTLTQMGRWFGYRVGYELLPRVWMPQDTVKVMKEICALEEDMHAQFSDMFERHDVKPNVRVLSISRRLTGRDAAAEVLQGVENPITVREFSVLAGSDQRVLVSEFLDNCDRAGSFGGRPDPKASRVWQRLYKWQEVDYKTVEEFVDKVCSYFSKRDGERIRRAMENLEKSYAKIDVVLSDPTMTGSEEERARIILRRANDKIVIHRHEISQPERLEDGCWRFGKFTGQYDAWKAVVPDEVVSAVEESYGIKSHTNEAMNELFKRKAETGGVNNPILQVGFIQVADSSVLYVSLYCPGKDCLEQARIGTANVHGETRSEIPHDAVPKKPRLSNVKTLASPNAVPHSSSTPIAKPGVAVEQKGGADSSALSISRLTEAEKCKIKEALNKLDKPWYLAGDFREAINSRVKGLTSKIDGEGGVFEFAEQSDWNKEETDDGNLVWAPERFAVRGGIMKKIRKQVIDYAKEALADDDGGIMSGDDLWSSALDEYALWYLGEDCPKGTRSTWIKNKLKSVVTINNTIPAKVGQGIDARQNKALKRLKEEFGIDYELKDEGKEYFYFLKK